MLPPTEFWAIGRGVTPHNTYLREVVGVDLILDKQSSNTVSSLFLFLLHRPFSFLVCFYSSLLLLSYQSLEPHWFLTASQGKDKPYLSVVPDAPLRRHKVSSETLPFAVF